jgi:uncharacterized membrane protein YfcA
MFEIITVSSVALLASLLTLFSGFGLGTLLMPVVALFFPIEVAIGVTAVVHLANNLFKVVLLGRHAHKEVLLKFGVTAVMAAFVGALVLGWLAEQGDVVEYQLMGHEFQTTTLKLVVGALILLFVILELTKWLKNKALDKKYLPLGGLISGFFGGLSGHQGAFRSMFLLKAGLTKEQFVATGVMVAVMVDISRLLIYGKDLAADTHHINWTLVIAATLSAFIGAYLGKKLLEKVTIKLVHILVSLLLIIVALGLMSGLI